MSVNDNVCVFSIAPKLDASEALLQLDQVKFPHNQWNDLATGLRLGGEIGKFDEGTDYNKKLQRLITYWCANEKHSWQQLVDAVVKCGQKMIAIQLAENVDATPPGKLTIVGVHYRIGHKYFLRGL